MFYEKGEDIYHIYPEGAETFEDILYVIGLVTVQLAKPVGLSRIQYKPEVDPLELIQDMSRSLTIKPDGNLALEMDYIQGRQVKTFVYERFDHLVFRSGIFERDRGSPEKMLSLVKGILARISISPR